MRAAKQTYDGPIAVPTWRITKMFRQEARCRRSLLISRDIFKLFAYFAAGNALGLVVVAFPQTN